MYIDHEGLELALSQLPAEAWDDWSSEQIATFIFDFLEEQGYF